MITNNIDNIAGLSKPLTKFIEVLQDFGETFYLPFKIKKVADAKGYEIERLADAEAYRLERLNNVKRTQIETLEDIEDTGEYLVEPNTKTMQLDESSLQSRVKNRFVNEQFKKQKNIDDIVFDSALIIDNKEKVSEEEVDEDWLNDFFRYAQDISNKSMKKIWAKILSGEIIKPNSYSKRTLNVLRNITKREAEAIQKLAGYIIKHDEWGFILPLFNNPIRNKIEFKYEDILLLQELGIIYSSTSVYKIETIKDEGEDAKLLFYIGDSIIYQEKKNLNNIQEFDVYPVTTIGLELNSLIEPPEPNKHYIEEVTIKLDIEFGEIYYCKIDDYITNPTSETLKRNKISEFLK